MGVFFSKILSLGARHVVLRALRTGIFVLSKKYAASSLTLDVVAGVVMDGWRKILSLGARLVVLRALRTGIFVLSKKYAASSLTLDVVAEVVMDGWRW